MSQVSTNVIIIGASGNLGPSILSAFDSNPLFAVSVLSRKSSKTVFPSRFKVHRVTDNYPEKELLSAFKDQNAIINMAPITEVAVHKAIIDAAIKAGVKRIILSEFGTNIPELQTTEPVSIFQGKAEIREYMKSRESGGLTWTGLVVGAFLDWGLQDGLLGFDLKARTAMISDSGDTPTSFSLLSATAKAAVSILEHSAKTSNRYVFINSFRCTQNEIFAALEKATGEKWHVEKTTCADESRRGRELMEKGDWSGVGPAIMGASSSGGKYDFAQGRQLDNELLGLPTVGTLESVVAKVVNGEIVE